MEGDRYILGTGTYLKKPDILTRGMEINNLVGTEFLVGPVRLRAPNHPAMPLLGDASGSTGFIQGAPGQRGISCEILSAGIIKEGDIITTSPD